MIYGLDISSYQGNPNFDQVKASGKEFVVIKATEGTDYINPYLPQSRSEGHRVGMVVGLYHFAEAHDPVAEANYFCDKIGTLANGEFLALDWEVSFGDPVGWCNKFLVQVQARTGLKPFIYLNLSTTRGYDWGSTADAGFALWLALYDGNANSVPVTRWSSVAIKQYTSTGNIPGVAGNCDVDVFFGSKDELLKYGQGGEMFQGRTAEEWAKACQDAAGIAEIRASYVAKLCLAAGINPDHPLEGPDVDKAVNNIDALNKQLADKGTTLKSGNYVVK